MSRDQEVTFFPRCLAHGGWPAYSLLPALWPETLVHDRNTVFAYRYALVCTFVLFHAFIYLLKFESIKVHTFQTMEVTWITSYVMALLWYYLSNHYFLATLLFENSSIARLKRYHCPSSKPFSRHSSLVSSAISCSLTQNPWLWKAASSYQVQWRDRAIALSRRTIQRNLAIADLAWLFPVCVSAGWLWVAMCS